MGNPKSMAKGRIMGAGDGGKHFKISPQEALTHAALDRPERRHPENKEQQDKQNTLSLSQEVSWVSGLAEGVEDRERIPQSHAPSAFTPFSSFS